MRGDLDLARSQLLHRMIAAMVPELQLVGLAAERDAGELVSETYAEDGLASHEAADIVDRVGAGLGIAGPVREEASVGLQRENVFGRCLCRDHRDLTPLAA